MSSVDVRPPDSIFNAGKMKERERERILFALCSDVRLKFTNLYLLTHKWVHFVQWPWYLSWCDSISVCWRGIHVPRCTPAAPLAFYMPNHSHLIEWMILRKYHYYNSICYYVFVCWVLVAMGVLVWHYWWKSFWLEHLFTHKSFVGTFVSTCLAWPTQSIKYANVIKVLLYKSNERSKQLDKIKIASNPNLVTKTNCQ